MALLLSSELLVYGIEPVLRGHFPLLVKAACCQPQVVGYAQEDAVSQRLVVH